MEVVCHFKYYNADDIHFSKVAYTYKFLFTINCQVSYTQTYNATYMRKDQASLVHVLTQYSSRPYFVNVHARGEEGKIPKGKIPFART